MFKNQWCFTYSITVKLFIFTVLHCSLFQELPVSVWKITFYYYHRGPTTSTEKKKKVLQQLRTDLSHNLRANDHLLTPTKLKHTRLLVCTHKCMKCSIDQLGKVGERWRKAVMDSNTEQQQISDNTDHSSLK